MNTNTTTKIYSLTRPELLSISDSNSTCFGGNQDWFLEEEKRKRGCGIVAAGNILMYMSGTATKYSRMARWESASSSAMRYSLLSVNGAHLPFTPPFPQL